MPDEGVFPEVRDGYDAVYGALDRGPTFSRLWREHAYGGDFPAELAHIGFLTTGEARRVLDLLELDAGDVLVDVACGAGGPGLWVASQSGATLIGVDPSAPGLAAARRRAETVAIQAEFREGTFARTGLADGTADAVMSIEAFQYAPDKRAALAELARVLRPGGRLSIVAFEVDPAKLAGVPVLGVDPVPDYAPLLEDAGFRVVAYEETPDWERRVYGAFTAVIAAADELRAEMGEHAAASVLAEAVLTVELEPYPRRVLLGAERTP